MNGKTQFMQDVDNILCDRATVADETWSEAYRRELDIVHLLATADFSAESQVQQTLKHHLLDSIFEKKEKAMQLQVIQKSLIRLTIAGLLIAFFVYAALPLGSSLAQTLIQTVQSWQPGENTTAVSVNGDFEAIPDENGETIILPASEPVGELEEILPDSEAELEQQPPNFLEPTTSLEAAQEQVHFTLRQPTFIPDGYDFQGVVVIHSGQASFEYINESENRLVGLLQTAVGGADGQVQVTFTDDVVVEDVQVNGREALWTQAGEEGMLIWEVDNVNYQLNGLGDMELALRIAESIE